MMLPERDDTQQKVSLIEERLKAIEGHSSIKCMNGIELSLVLDVIIPHKFKIPDFIKYNGSTFLKAHMMMFCQKMVDQTGNDKLLIHCFQESLTGSVARWYMKLDRKSNTHMDRLSEKVFGSIQPCCRYRS